MGHCVAGNMRRCLGVYNVNSEYRNYYSLLYNAKYIGNCTQYYEPYCDSRNWCHPTALE